MGRIKASPSSKIVIQLDAAAHEKLREQADAADRTVRDQARYLIKLALGLLPQVKP